MQVGHPRPRAAPRAHACGAGSSTTTSARRPASTSLPLKSWLGWGPPPALVELAEWAAWRWAGPASFFLGVASPDDDRADAARAARDVDRRRSRRATADARRPATRAAAPHPASTWRPDRAPPSCASHRPPISIDLVLSVVDDPAVRARGGSVRRARPVDRVGGAAARRGWCGGAARPRARGSEARAGWPVVVGSRAGAWAPVPRLAAAVVLDAHDAAYREESAPTYSAVEVLLERARREGVPVRARVAGAARSR